MRSYLAAVAGTTLVVAATLAIISQPGQSEDQSKIERGAYLADFGGCVDCHSPKIMVNGVPQPDPARHLTGHPQDEAVTPPTDGTLRPDGWMAACNANMTAWAGPWGVSFAPNLTPDKKTGLGNWTFEQFRDALRKGKHRGFGRPIMPPMPWMNYGKLNDEDLQALFMYLQSLPPISNQAPEWIKPKGMPEDK